LHSIFSFLLIIAVAAIGALIGARLKLPAGGMLGAMFAVIILQLLFEQQALPRNLQVILQIASGTMIGSRVAKKDVIGLRLLALPAIVLIFSMFVINIVVGTTMYRLSYLDIVTSLFASAPGGMMDMALVSAELGANPAYVALLQLSRLIFIFTCMMPFYRKIVSRFKVAEGASGDVPVVHDAVAADEATSRADAGLVTADEATAKAGAGLVATDPVKTTVGITKKTKLLTQNPLFKLCRSLLFGSIGGLILWRLGVPAGAIIGAMLGTAIFNVSTGKAYFPARYRLPLQIVAGAFIGMRMDRESLFAIGNLVIPALILFAGVVHITFATAFVVHKLTRLDFATCMLSSTPGGLTEMSLLADDLGLDAPKIAILQTSRLMSVIIFFPTMLYFVLRILG